MTDDKPPQDQTEFVRVIINNPEPVSEVPDEAAVDPSAPPENVADLEEHRAAYHERDADAGDAKPPPKRAKGVLPKDCPVIPLGVLGDMYYYLDALWQLRDVVDREHNDNKVISLFGKHMDYLRANWPRLAKPGPGESEPRTIGWQAKEVREDLMAGCARCGVWDVFGRVRGRGAWSAEDGGLVLHCGDVVVHGGQRERRTTPAGVAESLNRPGRIGRYVYPSASPLPRPLEAGKLETFSSPPGLWLLDLIETWNWSRGATDARLLLGWIGAAIVGGALKVRPLAWITGDAATGKSTLHELLGLLLGDLLLQVSDATAAGIWQEIQYASTPITFDELEPDHDDARRTQQVIKLARQAFSGGLVLRGGADHKGAKFTARSCFLFSSILIPAMMNQDRSRMAFLELGKIGDGATPPVLDPQGLATIGRALQRRLLDQWPRLPPTLALYRAKLAEIGHGNRGADQFGTLLACADLLIFDVEPDQDMLDAWTADLSAATLAERDDTLADHERMLHHLLTSPIDVFRAGKRRTVCDMVRAACARAGMVDPDFQPEAAAAVLETYGMRVLPDSGSWRLAIANSHQGLARIFEESHWKSLSGASGVWAQSARRIPGSESASLRFGGRSSRCWTVPLDEILVEDGN